MLFKLTVLLIKIDHIICPFTGEGKGKGGKGKGLVLTRPLGWARPS